VPGVDWSFGGAWPFEPRWFETGEGRMHYVDEGPRDGRPVVMVHGNPTWSFLYRNFIPPLVAAGYRAIAYDHLGFGRSDKPDDYSVYALERHWRRGEALLGSLGLRDVTLVPQDWGGPMSLRWAVENPDAVRSLFILNTNAHRPRGRLPIPLLLHLFRTPGVGAVLCKGLDLFKTVYLFRQGVVHRERLSGEVRRAYLAPHPSWSSRTPVLALPRQIPALPSSPTADFFGLVEAGLEREFRSKPVGIAWAMDDLAFSPKILDMWTETFPQAQVTRLPGAGHFLQEDAYERIVPALLEHLEHA
jgi:haloalkane dehalogenase